MFCLFGYIMSLLVHGIYVYCHHFFKIKEEYASNCI
jgi:hypothetical protein